MKIGVNLLACIPGKIGGMEQYVRNLLAYSIQSGDQNQWFLFLTKTNYHTFPNHPKIQKVMMHDHIDAHKQFHSWIRGLRLDLWFCPLLVLNPFDVSIPSVINIPDIQHEFYPQFFDDNSLQWRKSTYQSSALKANAVLTLSEYSRESIVAKFGVPANRVHAIHLDSAHEFTLPFHETKNQLVRHKYKLPAHYGFYPANTWWHKNHVSLLQALAYLRDEHKLKIHMVFTGAPQEAHGQVMATINQHQLSDQITWLDYILQEEMPYLFRNANFLCFPSLFEGFGIPLVEAMRTELPIICSNNGSIPEIVGDAALTFDPVSPEDIAKKMVEVQNEEVRSGLIAKGLQQASKFSWSKCAQQTLAVLHQVAGK
ncbi:glycosyltransferase family 1 protein [Brevibacillus agri]|uniref:glycosyltransferase family 4 protein n=1 Tax=Brevibacillus TaxID=55080 RepID=UPI000271CC7A|nr:MULTISPECIES: glycosyltransferase family 1 protein [Brevibacillus]ELK40390.1 mannosyltransferase B [Brevibacillus agri BAB-2500]EJL43060.1 glycosyltransferase [Brevibacillus sp. CF112]MBG9564165.1 mannosyltransferase [Brevibacillus agri]MDN4093880.1 glycosyltransferase family 1 protein [Brevibacillus agri]MDR9505477.1 glycosyltransferase family 1 protein [Brevibacillus agri]